MGKGTNNLCSTFKRYENQYYKLPNSMKGVKAMVKKILIVSLFGSVFLSGFLFGKYHMIHDSKMYHEGKSIFIEIDGNVYEHITD